MKKILVIGGYDPTGGAGITTDVRVGSLEGTFPLPIPTTLTIQDKDGLQSYYPLPDTFFERSLEIALSEEPDAIKIGLITEVKKARIIADKIKKLNIPIVFDPVLEVSRGGYEASSDLISSFKDLLIPISTLVTPNREELFKLSGKSDVESGVDILFSLGARAVLVKGGDLDEPCDILFFGGSKKVFRGKKIKGDFHGKGCALSTLIVSRLCLGFDLEKAVEDSIDILREGLLHPIELQKDWFSPNTGIKWEKIRILNDLEAALNILSSSAEPHIIPEVGSNLCYSLPCPRSIKDVAGFPTRIHSFKGRITAFSPPEFGGSSHVARALITAAKFNGDIRSAMNIRFDEAYIENAKEKGYRISFVDRRYEPVDKEGRSMEWITKRAFEEYSELDVVYDVGGLGKEAMIRVFGRDPFDVVEKVIIITKEGEKP